MKNHVLTWQDMDGNLKYYEKTGKGLTDFGFKSRKRCQEMWICLACVEVHSRGWLWQATLGDKLMDIERRPGSTQDELR